MADVAVHTLVKRRVNTIGKSAPWSERKNESMPSRDPSRLFAGQHSPRRKLGTQIASCYSYAEPMYLTTISLPSHYHR